MQLPTLIQRPVNYLFASLAMMGVLPAESAALLPVASCHFPRGALLELEGAVTQGGLNGRFRRVVDAKSGRIAEIADFSIFVTGHGYDGKTAWSQDVSGATHDLDSDFAHALAVSEAWLASHRGCGTKDGAKADAKAVPMSAATEGSHHFDVWNITPNNGAMIEVWYDPSTGLPEREILQYPESHLIRHFSDWRDIGYGRMVPFSQREEDPEDESTMEFHVDHASVRLKSGKLEFSRPEAPRDVHFLAMHQVTTVNYDDDHRTRVYVPVFLNGAGPFTFELDTGGHFILAANTAQTLGLVPQGTLSSTGAGNDIAKAGYVRVQELRIGDALVLNQPAKVLPLSVQSNDRGPLPPRAGILGLEFFERFTVSLDRRTKTMTLAPRGARYAVPRGQAVPIVFAEDAPLIAGTYFGVPGDFMLDSGNAGPTIIEQFWADKFGLSMKLETGLHVTNTAVASRGTIALGIVSLPDETVVYYGAAQRGSEYTRAVAGVLGEPLMSRFNTTYDYAHKKVWLLPLADTEALPYNRAGMVVAKMENGKFSVAHVLTPSPAADAGIKEGAVIEALDGQTSESLSRADVGAIFQRPVDSVLQLQVRDSGVAQPRNVAVRLRDLLE